MVCFSSFLAAPPSPSEETVKLPPPEDPTPYSIVQLVAVGTGDEEQNRACSASGFLINVEGYLITDAHAVEDAKQCLEKAPGGKILAKLTINDPRTAPAVPCDVIGIDVPDDLALLNTDRPLLGKPGGEPPYAKLDLRNAAVGTAAQVIGYPAFSCQPVTQAGHVTAVGRMRREETDYSFPATRDALGVDIHLRPGNSGSSVYRLDGGVVAVVDKGYPLRPAYSVAVAIHYAIELVERHGVRWHGVD